MQQNERDDYRREPHPDSMEAVIRFAFDFAHMVAAILAAPFELALRRKVGSRYQHIVVLALAPIFPLLVLAGSLTAGRLVHSTAPVGMGIVYAVLQVFLWLHYIHVFHVIRRPEKEESSREDGKALPIFKLLPGGNSWAIVRFVYEPGLLACGGLFLWLIHLVTPIVAWYFVMGAFALVVRAAFLYYYAWEYLREILDQFHLSQKIAGGANTAKADESLRRAIARALARRPVAVPQAVVESVQRSAERGLPKELRDLIDESDRAA